VNYTRLHSRMDYTKDYIWQDDINSLSIKTNPGSIFFFP